MSPKRKAGVRRTVTVSERCSCGQWPEFGSRVGSDEKVHSAFACRPAPFGCGKAGPEYVCDCSDRAQAAALWDRMQRQDKRVERL